MKIRDYDKEIDREIRIRRRYDIIYEIKLYFAIFWESLKFDFRSERKLLENEPNLEPSVKKLQIKYGDSMGSLETTCTSKLFDFLDFLCALFLATSPIWLTILFPC